MKQNRSILLQVVLGSILVAMVVCALILILLREKKPQEPVKVAVEIKVGKPNGVNRPLQETRITQSSIRREVVKETAKPENLDLADVNWMGDTDDYTGQLCQDLKTAIIDKDSNSTQELLDEIVGQRDESVYHLKSLLLESNEPDVKEFAAIGLARINSPKSVNELVDGIRKTQDENFHENLVKAFDEIKDTASADVLLEALMEEEPGILRDGIRDTLGRVADSEVVTNMVKLYGEFDGQETGLQQASLLETLLKVRSEEAVPELKDIIVKGKTISLSTNAALSLGAIGSESSVKALAAAISDENITGNESIYVNAMALISNDAATGILLDYLSNDNENVRIGAASALGNMPSEEVRAILEEAGQVEQSEEVRNAIESSKAKINKALITKETEDSGEI